MEKQLNISDSQLIPLLIKYKKVTGYLFPIEKVKYVSNEELIYRIKSCIKNKCKYDFKLYRLNNIQILNDDDLKKVIPLIIKSMEEINYDYHTDIKEIMECIDKRKNGKHFTFSDHLSALILTQLNNHRWGDENIKNNIDIIYSIFHNFEKNYLKIVEPKEIIEKLKEIHCTNPMIKKQIESLSYNIKIFESIEKQYGSLDNYILNTEPYIIASTFNEGKYKLKQVGKAMTYDYLKRVGINTCKYSEQMERLFGSTRLGIVKEEKSTHGQALTIIKKLADINNMSEIEIEYIIQQFCLLRSANICGEVPKCEKCQLRKYCNYSF